MTLIDQKLVVSRRFTVLIKVQQVSKTQRFPDGIKARYVLLDHELGKPRLLIDHHAPLGFHLHPELPDNHSKRTAIESQDYKTALTFFWKEVERVLKNEKD